MSGKITKKQIMELQKAIENDAKSGGGFKDFVVKHQNKFLIPVGVVAALAALYAGKKGFDLFDLMDVLTRGELSKGLKTFPGRTLDAITSLSHSNVLAKAQKRGKEMGLKATTDFTLPEYDDLGVMAYPVSRRDESKRDESKGDGANKKSLRMKKVQAYKKKHGCTLKEAWANI